MTVTAARLAAAMVDRDVDQPALAAGAGCTQSAISQILSGGTKRSRFLPAIADFLDLPIGWLNGDGDDAVPPRGERERAAVLTSLQRRFLSLLDHASSDRQAAVMSYLMPRSQDADDELEHRIAAEALDLVPVTSVDASYGMGATFLDQDVEVQVLHFPRQWIESVTATAPAHLAWARGRGNSMSPTIEDNDIILIDRSDRTVRDQDAIWAFTIGEIGYLKRLRMRGEKVTILSDNKRVPADTAHPDEINIIGRVSHIVRRL